MKIHYDAGPKLAHFDESGAIIKTRPLNMPLDGVPMVEISHDDYMELLSDQEHKRYIGGKVVHVARKPRKIDKAAILRAHMAEPVNRALMAVIAKRVGISLDDLASEVQKQITIQPVDAPEVAA